jgi:hypothetical protein
MKALGAFGAVVAVPGAAKAVTEKSETSKPETQQPETQQPETPQPEDQLAKYENLRFDPPAKPGTDRVNVHKPESRSYGGTSKRADAQDVVVTLERGDKKTIMHLGDGSFTFTENKEYNFFTDRGVLDRGEEKERWVDFDLSGVYDWVQGDLIGDTLDLKNEANALEPVFKMTIDTGNREYICAEGMWTAFSFDADAATFDLQGRFSSMEQVHFFET